MYVLLYFFSEQTTIKPQRLIVVCPLLFASRLFRAETAHGP